MNRNLSPLSLRAAVYTGLAICLSCLSLFNQPAPIRAESTVPPAVLSATPTPTATSTPNDTPTPTKTSTPTRVPGSIAVSEFGLVFVNSAENPSGNGRIQRGADTGAHLDRFPLYWDRMETGYGQFNWASQDAALAANEARGLGTLAILLGTPGHYRGGIWAGSAEEAWQPLPIGGSFARLAGSVLGHSPRAGQSGAGCNAWDGPPPPSGLWNPIYTDGTDRPAPGKTVSPENPWARFVSLVVARYKPGGPANTNVRHWEIWNEPDLCHFWSGTPEEYARLLKVAYLVIKQTDPGATVLWGGLAHFANGDFLPRMMTALQTDSLAAEYRGFFDAAASHHYSLSYQGLEYTARIRSALNRAGWGDKPIWITESGVPVCNDFPGPACPSPWRASAEEQAAYIWQNVAYTRIAGGGPIFHFMLHDDCGNVVAPNSPDGFGIYKNESSSYCSPANAAGRLAASAFRLANRYFPDTVLVWADIQDWLVRRVAFFHPGSRERRLLTFAITAQPALARIPAAGSQARRIALDGSEMILTPSDGYYEIALPGATNRNWPDGNGGYDIGIYGAPYLLVEEDTLPPTATINALPPISPPEFSVRWQAVDWGAGVQRVELWTQVDGGDWRRWRSDLEATGGLTYTGVVGQRVAFAARGIDKLGQFSATLSPQTETEISKPPTRAAVSGRVINPEGQGVISATVAVGPVNTVTDQAGNFQLSVPFGVWDVAVNGRVINRGRSFGTDALLLLLHVVGGNSVVNGDFESGQTGWTQSGSSPSGVEQQPGTDDHALRLATAFVPNSGVPGTEGSDGGNSTWSQSFQIPGGRPFLALAYRVESQEGENGQDKFEVILVRENHPPDYLLVQTHGSEWQYRFFDLSAYAGQQATLILNVYESSPYRRTSALVDQVVLSDVTRGESIIPSHFIYAPAILR